MTAATSGAVTVSTPVFSANGTEPAEKVSAKKTRVSVSRKPRPAKAKILAETFSGLQLNVDDDTLFGFISAGRVGVHKNGSRQKRHGQVYDYRSSYRALRLNCGDRKVLAFGTPDRLKEKLAQLGVFLCFGHRRPVLTVGASCRQCGSREVIACSLTGRA